jgi:hypothetical protein
MKYKYHCPECEQELEAEEVRVMYTESDTEEVWICKNKECENYQEAVFDSGDIDMIEQSIDEEQRFENERLRK